MDSAVFTSVVSTLSNKSLGLVIDYEHGVPETRARAFRRMKATKSMYSTNLSYSRASAGESVPSFALSASSSRHAWNSGLGSGSSAKCLASSGVNPCVRCSTNLSSVSTPSFTYSAYLLGGCQSKRHGRVAAPVELMTLGATRELFDGAYQLDNQAIRTSTSCPTGSAFSYRSAMRVSSSCAW